MTATYRRSDRLPAPVDKGQRRREFITMPAFQHPAEYFALKGKEAPPQKQHWVSWTPRDGE